MSTGDLDCGACEMPVGAAESNKRILLSNELPAHYDITSVSLPSGIVDRLSVCRILVGGMCILALDALTLSTIPEVDGQREVLTPFMARLPLSKLLYHETHLLLESTDHALPAFTITLTKDSPFSGEVVIPMLQPQKRFLAADRCIRSNAGVVFAPNAFRTLEGMGAVCIQYD